MTSYLFFKFKFVIISFKNYNLAKSRNFRSPKSKVKGRWGWRAPALSDFWKFVIKI